MNEVVGYLILGLIGFVIGGILGMTFDNGFQPWCWYGLLAAFGGPIIVKGACD